MPINITTDEALKRLAADPQTAAEFDAATAKEYPQATSRRDAVQWILAALNAKLAALQASSAATRAKLASARATLAAQGQAKDSIDRFKGRQAPAKPNVLTRSQFQKLTPAERMKFIKDGGTLI